MRHTIITLLPTFICTVLFILGARFIVQEIKKKPKTQIVFVNTTDTIIKYVPIPEVELLAKTINGESEGEPLTGKIAVGNSILNKVKRDDSSVREVIYKKGIYDCVGTALFLKEPLPESYVAAYLSYMINVIPDSTYYFLNEKISTDIKWMKKMEKKSKLKIGRHSFYY